MPFFLLSDNGLSAAWGMLATGLGSVGPMIVLLVMLCRGRTIRVVPETSRDVDPS
jgi:hypothetical protein